MPTLWVEIWNIIGNYTTYTLIYFNIQGERRREAERKISGIEMYFACNLSKWKSEEKESFLNFDICVAVFILKKLPSSFGSTFRNLTSLQKLWGNIQFGNQEAG